MNIRLSSKSFRAFFLLALIHCISASGQNLRILSAADSGAMDNVAVTYTIQGSPDSHVLFSDEQGIVDLSGIHSSLPLLINIFATGYQPVPDTIFSADKRSFYLQRESNSLNEVVITGQYTPGSIDRSVHVVKVIGRDMINKMAAQNLRDVLSHSLNIRLSQDNILGSSMSLQGITGQDVKVLIDGVPVIGRQNGNIDISQINLNNVERIEIVEGPLSVNYGTDALAGTINIITKKTQRATYQGQADLYYESNGEYNLSGKAGFQKKNNTIQLTLGRNYFDGWNEGDKPFVYKSRLKNDSNRVQAWKPKEQLFGSLLYARRIKGLNLSLSSRLFDEDIINRGAPRPPYGASALDDNYRTIRSSNAISINGRLNEHYRADFILDYNYYKRVKNSFYKDLTTLDKQLTSGTGDQDTSVFSSFMFRGDIASTKSSRLNYEAGYDLHYETNQGQQIEGLKKDMGDYALFATAEYAPFKNLVIKPGLRIAYNTKFHAPLIPSLNLKYNVPLSGEGGMSNLILRASYAQGFRAPSLKELYFDFVDINHDIHGNEHLKAEYSDNFIFNAVLRESGSRTGFKLEWNNFYNKIHNLIVLAQAAPSSAEYTYANLGFFQTYGSNLTAELSVQQLRFSVSAGIVALYNQLHEADPQADKFSYSPEMNASLIYGWKRYGVAFAVFYKYTGKTPGYILDENEMVKQNTLGDYQMADISASKSVLNNKLKITIGSKNIFNITNIAGSLQDSPHATNSYATPLSMGRTYFLSASLNLNYK